MPRKKYTKEERIQKFWDRVNITGLLDCWPWQGYRKPSGYGQVQNGEGSPVHAHRFAWKATYGEIPDGLYVLHKCDNPPCCNPAHLFLRTNADNMRDKGNKGRQSHAGAGPQGMANNRSKLRDTNIPEIRLLLRQGVSQRLIATKYGVHESRISCIKRGKAWSHID